MFTRNYPTGFKPPLYNVLLISCMDLRLLENITHFMEHENLVNRYDQYIMAGASIGALMGTSPAEDDLMCKEDYKGWETGLLQHVDLAIKLHNIKDIYILEHRNCGAYKAFLKDGQGDYETLGYTKEFDDHKKYAQRLSDRLQDYLAERDAAQTVSTSNSEVPINIHGFIMDIRGNVELLCTTAPFVDPLAKAVR